METEKSYFFVLFQSITINRSHQSFPGLASETNCTNISVSCLISNTAADHWILLIA